MDDFLRNALIRKLATAEGSGNEVLAARIRARLKPAAPVAEPEPVVEAEPEPEPEPVEEEAAEADMPAEVDEPADTVPFASPQAEDLAAQYGLGHGDFDFPYSGKTGYTAADVRRAAGINQEDD